LRTLSGKTIDPDPITQAQRARGFFVDLAKRKENLGFIPWEVFAAFPDMAPERPFGPTGFEDVMIWRSHLDTEAEFLEKILKDRRVWRELPSTRKKSVYSVQRLLMSERRVPPLGRRMAETEQDIEVATSSMIQLNEEQLEIVREEFGHLKTVTNGRAGTGKTTLAIHRAIQLANAGHRVLFFTPNVFLSTRIRELFNQEGLLFETQENLGFESGTVNVRSLDAVGRSPHDVLHASDLLAEQILNEKPEYSALIVDEYQDVTQTLFDSLLLLLESGENELQIHAFGDKAQAIRLDDPWTPSDEFNVMGLTRQCRCSEPIQRLVDGVMGARHRPNGILGVPVEFQAIGDAAQQVVARLLSYRDHQGVNLGEITPIVCVPGNVSREIDLTNEISRLGAKYKISGSMIAPKVADQFKGCESSAVILLVEGDDLDAEALRYLYMTISRARAHLTVIASRPIIEHLTSL
jgi:DNA replication protein DnaC